MADRMVVPRFRRGSWGALAEMNRNVDMLCGEALKALRRQPLEDQPEEPQVHFWRLGFMGAAYAARDIALGHGAPIPKC